MILYGTFSNDGGMKRVASGLSHGVDGLLALVFSKKPIQENPGTIVVRLESEVTSIHGEELEKVRSALQKKLRKLPIRAKIIDAHTWKFLDFLDVPYFYDVHSLTHPVMNVLFSAKNTRKLDTLHTIPWTFRIELAGYAALRVERKLIRGSAGIISNSENSSRYLRELYLPEEKEIPILQAPLSISMPSEKKSLAGIRKKYPYYIFTRMHPMKGLQNIFFRDWSKHPIHIRGISSSIFSQQALDSFARKGIHLLPWTDDDSVLAQDLARSEVVLFPALYEPYGLALQEALSRGCLCVAQDNDSGHAEQIQNGKNGFFIDMSKKDLFKTLEKIRKLDTTKKRAIKSAARRSVLVRKRQQPLGGRELTIHRWCNDVLSRQ